MCYNYSGQKLLVATKQCDRPPQNAVSGRLSGRHIEPKYENIIKWPALLESGSDIKVD